MKQIYLMLLSLVMMGCGSIHEEDDVVERIAVGDRVPVFSVGVVANGQSTTFSTSHLTGETVIVFFNTWCSDCQRELPKLNQFYLTHQDEGLQMVAISRGEEEATVAKFWADHHLQIPYSAQTDRHVYELFASSIIPRVYFVSEQGIVTKILIEHFDL